MAFSAGLKLASAVLLAGMLRSDFFPDRTETMVATSAGRVAAPPTVSEPGRASFSVKIRQEVNPYLVLGMFVLPGEKIPLELSDSAGAYTVEADAGSVQRLGGSRWSWTAPLVSGAYPVLVRHLLTGERMTLNAFVLVPAAQEPTLNGFRIGLYRVRPLRGDTFYARPRGFVEVTEMNQGMLVSPHFTLGQFASKQAGGFPKYLVLRERLLLKLELLLEEVRSSGIRATSFRILSGYRTPYYNRTIGNETSYSRHLYGDAADIYVDEDGDGRMDDLDGDGRVSLADARALGVVIDSLSAKSWYQPFQGGLGLYQGTTAHGPFVHVDVRGSPAQWSPE